MIDHTYRSLNVTSNEKYMANLCRLLERKHRNKPDKISYNKSGEPEIQTIGGKVHSHERTVMVAIESMNQVYGCKTIVETIYKPHSTTWYDNLHDPDMALVELLAEYELLEVVEEMGNAVSCCIRPTDGLTYYNEIILLPPNNLFSGKKSLAVDIITSLPAEYVAVGLNNEIVTVTVSLNEPNPTDTDLWSAIVNLIAVECRSVGTEHREVRFDFI